MIKAGDTIKIPEQEIVCEQGLGSLLKINGVAFSEKELLALGAVKVSYKSEEIEVEFKKMKYNELLSVLHKSLFLAMRHDQRYDPKDKTDFIYMAMGYKKDSDKENTWYKVGEEGALKTANK